MAELEINKALYDKIADYLFEKGYAHNTLIAYKLSLYKLLHGNEVLDKELVARYLKKNKHPNQRAIIRIINQYCLQTGLDFNVTLPMLRQKPRKIPDILSIEEIKLMIGMTKKPYDLMLRCVYGIGSGLRVSEVIKLCWYNIRWVEWLKDKEYGVAILKETKRDTERVVNIPNEIMNDLYSLAKERNILNEFGIPQGSLIFPIDNDYKSLLYSSNKEQWKNEYIKHAYDWVRYNIIKPCSKALNKKIHIHMLRHSRATYLYEVEKLPIERIQQLLGHKDLQSTMIYTRVDPKSTFNMMKDTKVL